VAGGGVGKRDVELGAGAGAGLASSEAAPGSAPSPVLASSPEAGLGPTLEPPPLPLVSTIAPPPLPLGCTVDPPLLPPLEPPLPEVDVDAKGFDEEPLDPSLPAAQPTRHTHPRTIAREDGCRADLFISGSPCPRNALPPAGAHQSPEPDVSNS
jgi:hypothetical protein